MSSITFSTSKNSTSASKPSTMSSKFYAVKKGKVPGIYRSWTECQTQTKRYSGAIFKSFSTREEAENFIGQENQEVKYEYTVYTDGSYMNNNSGGSAVVIENKSVFFAKTNVDSEQTNNRGELLGIRLALQNTSGNILIYTDSQYSINVLSNGYTSKKNLDMIQQIHDLMKDRIVHYKYVPAHTGVLYNEIADKYAKMACSLENDSAVSVTSLVFS